MCVANLTNSDSTLSSRCLDIESVNSFISNFISKSVVCFIGADIVPSCCFLLSAIVDIVVPSSFSDNCEMDLERDVRCSSAVFSSSGSGMLCAIDSACSNRTSVMFTVTDGRRPRSRSFGNKGSSITKHLWNWISNVVG